MVFDLPTCVDCKWWGWYTYNTAGCGYDRCNCMEGAIGNTNPEFWCVNFKRKEDD